MEHRSQKKQAIINKIQLGEEAAPLEERKALPNTNESTGNEAAESGSQVSQELTSSSAPNIPDEKYTSDFPAEENLPQQNINKDNGKETESGSQELATSSVQEVPESRAPLERPTQPNINYNSGRGSQELTSSSAPSIPFEKHVSALLAEENLPIPKINKDTGKEKEVPERVSQCSQDLTTSSVPKVRPDWVPEMDNIHPSAKQREAGQTFESLYNSLLHPDWIPSLLNPDIVDEIEFVQVPKTNETTGRETESTSHGSQEFSVSSVSTKTVEHSTNSPDIKSEKDFPSVPNTIDNTGKETGTSFHGSQELTTPSVRNKTVKHSTSTPDITSQMKFPPLPGKNKNTGKEQVESGSQVSKDSFSSSVPNIPDEKYTSDLPAEDNPPLPKINKDTGKETEVTESGSQCSHDLTTSSVPKVLPDPVPPMDSIHSSLTFGSSLHQDRSPNVLSPHHSSHGSQESTISSVPKKTVKHPLNIDSNEEFPPLGSLPKKKKKQ